MNPADRQHYSGDCIDNLYFRVSNPPPAVFLSFLCENIPKMRALHGLQPGKFRNLLAACPGRKIKRIIASEDPPRADVNAPP
jgi:hypothetical protein